MAVTAAPPTAGQLRADQADSWKIGRMFAEVGAGYLTGLGGYLIGGLIGVGAGCRVGGDAIACATTILVGASVGLIFTTPLGTIAAGSWMHGTGDYLGALAGSAVGTVAYFGAMVLIAQTRPATDQYVNIGLLTLLIPAVGAMLGYEMQGDANNAQMRESGVAVTPMIAPLMAENGDVNGGIVGVNLSNW